jgi:hypothetical protein
LERFVSGDVVVLPFPFSDLTGSKRRPALVLAGGQFYLATIGHFWTAIDTFQHDYMSTRFPGSEAVHGPTHILALEL